MENRNQRDEAIRQPQPEAAARDPRNAQIQEQVHADSEVNRREAARVRATTPTELSEKTVAEIAADAEARARG
jgi:hypothetical protein